MKRIVIAGLAVAGLTLAACAAGTGEAHAAASAGFVSQIVVGFWHGLIAPLTLLVEVINKLVPGILPIQWHMYEAGSPSVAYDVGFYFGLAGGPGILFFRRRRL
ncbi:MAG: hypothetical protein ABI376_08450 [Caulobacteraceae bacterium]